MSDTTIHPMLNREAFARLQDELILDVLTYGFSMTRIEPKKVAEPVAHSQPHRRTRHE